MRESDESPGAVPLTEAARVGQGIPRQEHVAEAAQTGQSVEAVAKGRDGERADQKPQPGGASNGHTAQTHGSFSLKKGVKILGLGAAVFALEKINGRRRSTE
ncbi:MAG: hypothetical protein U0768_10930 [Anaerolineae bacterium]